ncbi:MAG: right-handed parallel beta-helix repeat-containing protein [Myxococcales bacterium]|nr:right-handed parallel beta-helix repeat-containing protein [Myxococcales bacterium]MDH3486265.1 right-handed parallel beta-helix repeat-containing protein [Myxococcales bacterium]
MGTSVSGRLWTSCLLSAGVALAVFLVDATHANAFRPAFNAWQAFYPDSTSGDTADCQLCHLDPNPPGRAWNGYGWDFFLARGNVLPGMDCDGDGSGVVSFEEAFICIEGLDSDMDPGMFLNIEEINLSTQPGWTNGPNNTIFTEAGDSPNQLPPNDIGPLDPGGAGGMGGTGGMGGDDMFPPGQFKRDTIVVVNPGQSIQEAIDRAQEGTRIYVLAGVYEEPNNPTNGLNITKSGIHLIGQSNPQKRVILKSTNGQRNGIVIVPPDVPAAAQPQGREVERTDCMGCHTDMGPPFPLHPDVPTVILMDEDPWIYDIVIEGITIEGFENNGLFTEHVDGFVFDDVESKNNRNYGIFPVLSKNGVITNCRSTGSDKDSALWVETSENVLVIGNVVEDSVNGIEVSNSDDILVIDNEMRNNTIGAAILLLPDIYPNRAGAKRIDLRNNWVHDNNRPNTARPTSILGSIPRGIGILYVGVDESAISGNLVENNNFTGIAVVDYCPPFEGTPFACGVDPDTLTPGFLEDQAAENNRVVGNILVENGTNPRPEENPFAFAAADLTLLTVPPPFPPDHGNCYLDNTFTTYFSLFDALTGNPQPPPPCL